MDSDSWEGLPSYEDGPAGQPRVTPARPAGQHPLKPARPRSCERELEEKKAELEAKNAENDRLRKDLETERERRRRLERSSLVSPPRGTSIHSAG